jgi:hypothetical protein
VLPIAARRGGHGILQMIALASDERVDAASIIAIPLAIICRG